MRFTQPVNNEPTLLYNTVKIQGCVDSTVGFNFLKSEPITSKRRYCNKVLVHECVSLDVNDSIELTKVEFLATDDPCYTYFNIFKTSVESEEISPTIDLQLDESDYTQVIGVLVNFVSEETCDQPIRLAYRLYGYTVENEKILLSNGNLFITPCICTVDSPAQWTDISW